jgi:hypothetical protein
MRIAMHHIIDHMAVPSVLSHRFRDLAISKRSMIVVRRRGGTLPVVLRRPVR